LLAQLAELFI